MTAGSVQDAANTVERVAPIHGRQGNGAQRFFAVVAAAKEYGLPAVAVVDELVRRRKAAKATAPKLEAKP